MKRSTFSPNQIASILKEFYNGNKYIFLNYTYNEMLEDRYHISAFLLPGQATVLSYNLYAPIFEKTNKNLIASIKNIRVSKPDLYTYKSNQYGWQPKSTEMDNCMLRLIYGIYK